MHENKCECPMAGYCSKMKREMSEIRHEECKNKPGYYEVFLKNAERKAEQQEKDGKLPTKKPLKPNRTRIIYDPKKHGKGPGTELKKILSKWGIKAKANCACNKNMKIMDESGPDWCDANLETIVDWIEKEAKKRSLPFLRIVGRKLVRMAIKRARKAK